MKLKYDAINRTMKKNISFLFIVIILSNIVTLYTFAQSVEDAENIWSRVRIEPSGTEKIDPNFKWDESAYKPRFIYSADATVGPNFRPWGSSNTTQSELSIDVHPLDENIIFASANATPWPVAGIWGTGVYWSLDGAASWVG